MKIILYKNCFILKVIYLITLIIAALKVKTAMQALMVLVSLVLPFVFPILFKCFHKKMSDEFMAINIIFIYFASLIGSCLGGYSIPYYDKFVHFASGIIAFTLGLLVYKGWVKDKMSEGFKHTFCHLFNVSIAAFWEFYEYFMLVVFNNDCIRHYTTGVHDALTDMICAFIGGIVISCYILLRKGKPSFFENLVNQFYSE